MNKKVFALLTLVGAATLAACGGPDGAHDETSVAPPAQSTNTSANADTAGASKAAGEIYSGTGDITQIADGKLTISHGPIAGIGWPAMTMAFSAQSPEMLQALNVGDKVAFQFRKAGSDYVVTSINKAQ